MLLLLIFFKVSSDGMSNRARYLISSDNKGNRVKFMVTLFLQSSMLQNTSKLNA